jgi:hypothetical protein
MPLTTTKVLAKEARVTIHVDGDSLTTAYYPHRCTKSALAALANAESTSEDDIEKVNALFDVLCVLIKNWDFYEDEEQTTMVPITPERFNDVSLPILQAVAMAIFQDANPEVAAPQKPMKLRR